MARQILHAGPRRGVRMVGVVLVVLGAAVMGASAATSSFDLGEDLELGKAVHDVEQVWSHPMAPTDIELPRNGTTRRRGAAARRRRRT